MLSNRHKAQILLLIGILESNAGNTEKANSVFFDARRCDESLIDRYLRQKEAEILPLNTGNEFSSRFPFIQVPSSGGNIQVRPAISLPRVSTPKFDFNIEKKAKELFTIQKVTPKPEAPWLNRTKDCIQFTEVLVDISSHQSSSADLNH